MATTREPLISLRDVITYGIMIGGWWFSYTAGREEDRTRITKLEMQNQYISAQVQEFKTVLNSVKDGINENAKVNDQITELVNKLDDYQSRQKRPIR